MIFAKELILKGVAGLAVVGGLGAGGIYVWNQRKEESLEFLTEKVGLECTAGTPNETTGVQCNKKGGENVKVKVKKDNDTIELSSITSGGGKIKVYKLTASGDGTTGYNKDFKFVIEDNDISGTGNNKLEQFETYEIKEHGGTHYLTRREKAVDVKKKRLGLPSDAECKLPEDGTEATCTLNKDKLKAINFEGKNAEGEPTIEGADNNGEQINLKISKSTDTPFTEEGYKFVLETNKNITIPGTTPITIKKGTNTEFKIKKSGTGNGTTFSLEKAWTLEEFAKKVGLKDCTNGNGTAKECGFTSSKVNLFNGEGDYTKGASVSDSKKIKVEVDKEDHNQGFKFYVEEADIALQGGTPNGGKKIVKKESEGTPTYEIKEQSPTNGGTKDWYLSKVTAAVS